MISEDELKRLEGLCEGATKGPWVDWYGALCIDVTLEEYSELVGINIAQGPPFQLPKKKANMDLIVASREAVPALVAEVRRLNQWVQNLRDECTLMQFGRDNRDSEIERLRGALEFYAHQRSSADVDGDPIDPVEVFADDMYRDRGNVARTALDSGGAHDE